MKNHLQRYILDVNTNLKYTTTTRTNPEQTSLDFLNALQTMRGIANKKEDTAPYFNDVLYSAIAYFFSSIYGRDTDNFTPHTIKDSYYTIDYLKTCFDNDNKTGFTPINRNVGAYVQLSNAPLYKACYMVIQTAHHLASHKLEHQFLQYIDFFVETKGEKLSEDAYLYDIDVLNKKYNDIKKTNFEHQPHNYYRNLWYYSQIELILDGCNITNLNFQQQNKDGQHRYYNCFALCPRTLRKEQCFEMGSVDISSAYPSIIDSYVGSRLSHTVYDNLVNTRNISRTDAKILFNTYLNYAKYRKPLSKKSNEYHKFLTDAGYTSAQATKIRTELTDNPTVKWFDYASKIEHELITNFRKANDIQGTRVHDAIYFAMDRNVDMSKWNYKFSNYTFKFSKENRVNENIDFFNSNRYLNFISFQFAPKNTLIFRREIQKASEHIGNHKDYVAINQKKKGETVEHKIFLDIDVFNKPSLYQSANFKAMELKNGDVINFFNSFEELANQYYKSFSFCKSLNNALTLKTITQCLEHHRKYANLCFDVHTMAEYIFNMDLDTSIEMPVKKRYYKFNNEVSNLQNEFILNAGISKATAIVKKANKIRTIANHCFENGLIYVKRNKHHTTINEMVKNINILVYGKSKLLQISNETPPLSKEYYIRVGVLRCICNKTRHKPRKQRYSREIQNLDKKHTKQLEMEAEMHQLFTDIKHHRITKNSTYNLPAEIWNDDIKIPLLKTTPPTKIEMDAKIPNFNQWDTDLSMSMYFTSPPTYAELTRPQYKYTDWENNFYTFHKENWESVLNELKTSGTVSYYKPNLHAIELKELETPEKVLKTPNFTFAKFTPTPEPTNMVLLKKLKNAFWKSSNLHEHAMTKLNRYATSKEAC